MASQGSNIVERTVDTSTWLVSGIRSRDMVWIFMVKLILTIIIVWVLTVWAKLFSNFVSKRLKSHSIVDDEYTWKLSGLVGEIIFYTLLVIIILVWFTILGIDFWWILWWISFGIWFAFKDILWNLIAWVLVLTNKDFRLGDVIVIDDDNKEYFGRIEEITIRYTVLRAFDLRKVIVPNLTLVTKPIRTYDSEDVIRLETMVTVHYWTNVASAMKLITAAVNGLDYIKERKSTKVTVQKFADSWIDLLIYFYIDPKWWMLVPTAISGVHEAVFEAFSSEWVTIPYPHRTLTVDYNDKNLLGSMIYVAQEANKSNKWAPR